MSFTLRRDIGEKDLGSCLWCVCHWVRESSTEDGKVCSVAEGEGDMDECVC